MICDSSNFHSNLKYMKKLLKMNLKYHFEYDIEFILKELTNDTRHVQQKLDGLLLTKEDISIPELFQKKILEENL